MAQRTAKTVPTTIQIASKDVPEAYRKLQEAALAAEARIMGSQLNENDRQNVTATLSFDVRRGEISPGQLDGLNRFAGDYFPILLRHRAPLPHEAQSGC